MSCWRVTLSLLAVAASTCLLPLCLRPASQMARAASGGADSWRSRSARDLRTAKFEDRTIFYSESTTPEYYDYTGDGEFDVDLTTRRATTTVTLSPSRLKEIERERGREREKERERQREREREMDRLREEKNMERMKEIEKERDRDMELALLKERERDKERDMELAMLKEREKHREREKQKEIEIELELGKEREKQREREKQIDNEIETVELVQTNDYMPDRNLISEFDQVYATGKKSPFSIHFSRLVPAPRPNPYYFRQNGVNRPYLKHDRKHKPDHHHHHKPDHASHHNHIIYETINDGIKSTHERNSYDHNWYQISIEAQKSKSSEVAYRRMNNASSNNKFIKLQTYKLPKKPSFSVKVEAKPDRHYKLKTNHPPKTEAHKTQKVKEQVGSNKKIAIIHYHPKYKHSPDSKVRKIVGVELSKPAYPLFAKYPQKFLHRSKRSSNLYDKIVINNLVQALKQIIIQIPECRSRIQEVLSKTYIDLADNIAHTNNNNNNNNNETIFANDTISEPEPINKTAMIEHNDDVNQDLNVDVDYNAGALKDNQHNKKETSKENTNENDIRVDNGSTKINLGGYNLTNIIKKVLNMTHYKGSNSNRSPKLVIVSELDRFDPLVKVIRDSKVNRNAKKQEQVDGHHNFIRDFANRVGDGRKFSRYKPRRRF